MLTLPGDPLFDFIINTCPPPGQTPDQLYFVVDSETGLIRNANKQQLEDYLFSGEYDDRLQDINFHEDSLED